MFVLITYDVTEKRTEVFRAFLSRFLHHEQNSVFSGTVGQAALKEIRAGLSERARPEDRFIVLTAANRHNVCYERLSKAANGLLVASEDRTPDEKLHVL